jgi:pyruvate dehydrogenase E2 component (dihydrolipoamide acetyltransferase)
VSDPFASSPEKFTIGKPPAEAAHEVQEISPMRRAIAQRTRYSVNTAPHFYVAIEVDMSAALAARAEMKQRDPEGAPSVNDFLLKATADAVREHPAVNVSYQDDGLHAYTEVNLGMIVGVEDALLIPVIPGADQKTLEQIAAESRELVAKARNKRLRAKEQEGGTFTVSNLGPFGIDWFTAVLNPPQACLLTAGAAKPRPVVIDGEIAARPIMTCGLSIDHRAVDGVHGAEFLQAVRSRLESWGQS